MRIAYVCADQGIALCGVKGASVHMRSLAAALARRGHRVLVACARTDGPNPMPAGVRVTALPPNGQAEWLIRTFKVAEIESVLERYSLSSSAGMEAAQALGLPFTLEVNAPLADEAARFRGLPNVDWWRARERDLIREAGQVVVVSAALRDHALACGALPGVISVVPNGVDVGRYRQGGRAAIRSKFGIEGSVVFGFVGSLKAWHGVSVLLEAFAALPRTHRLLVVGDGPERVALETQAGRLGVRRRVVFAGAVPHAEVPAYLDAMDVGVAPFEPISGFYFSPLKVIEYLAAGLPVVASRQGDLPQVVGDAGILYEPGSPDALIDALRRLADDRDLRTRLRRNAVARTDSLDWNHVAARIEKVLAGPLHQGTRA